MTIVRSYSLFRYSIAGTSVLVALALTMSWPQLEEAPTTLFFAAVMVSACYGGLGPGLLATALSVLVLDYFFVPPLYSLEIGLADGMRLGVFVTVAILISSLNAARRQVEGELRRQSANKDWFLATLAHEVRSPLAALTNALEFLRQPGLDAAVAEQVRAIAERGTATIARHMDDLLDVARIGNGKLRLDRKRVELGAVVAQAVETALPLIEARRHQLEVARLEREVWLEADPARLEQVLVNLLANAARYTDAGGRVTLTTEHNEGEVRLRVRDTGRGIAPDILPHIFEPFRQAARGEYGGLGIGLSLVRGLVRMHGGSVTASSDGAGKGSEFTVRIPVAGHGPRERERRSRPSPVGHPARSVARAFNPLWLSAGGVRGGDLQAEVRG
jgi:signal transduction histidine kinase